MQRLIWPFLIVLTVVTVVPAQVDTALRTKVFEKVWGTVNEKFYDPGFNGVDWKKVHDQFLPKAVAARTDEEFYGVLTQMLQLLKVSHMEVGSAAQVAKMKQTPSTIGVGLRVVESRLTVTRVIRDFPAEKAGLRTGFIIKTIDGNEAKDVDEAKRLLAGTAGAKAKITYLDENNIEHDADIERRSLTDNDKGKIAGVNFYALFDSRRLEGGIGYFSFTSFVPFLNERIAAALDEFNDAPGMIIDLRGNGGGDDSVGLKIASRLFDKDTQLMLIRTRKGELNEERVHANKKAYGGKVVILVDEFSGSASEEFAAGMQEARRAIVIGQRTAGEDLDADIAMLPDGGMLVYAFGFPHTPKGFIVEGHGVEPDITVALKRSDLLAGHDTQIDAAVDYLLAKRPTK